jgi:hypothetical protein
MHCDAPASRFYKTRVGTFYHLLEGFTTARCADCPSLSRQAYIQIPQEEFELYFIMES